MTMIIKVSLQFFYVFSKTLYQKYIYAWLKLEYFVKVVNELSRLVKDYTLTIS